MRDSTCVAGFFKIDLGVQKLVMGQTHTGCSCVNNIVQCTKCCADVNDLSGSISEGNLTM